MATATIASGDGRDRVAVRERNREGEREQRVRGRGERPLGVSVAHPKEAASRWKQGLAHAQRPRAPAPTGRR